MRSTPEREIKNPSPLDSVHETPFVADRHWNGPAPVAVPYANVGVSGAGLPRSHWFPVQVSRTPAAVIVTVRGGEKVAQRTASADATSIEQAMFSVGERKAPFKVAVWRGCETTTVAVPVTSSGAQAGGGSRAFTSSLKL
jgi:hypothetical protein